MYNNKKTVTLLGDASVYEIDQHARQLKGVLDDVMMSGEALEIELGQLGDVDATFCQLLAAVKAECERDDVMVRFTNPSALLIEKLEDLEMAEYMGLSSI